MEMDVRELEGEEVLARGLGRGELDDPELVLRILVLLLAPAFDMNQPILGLLIIN